MSNKMNILFESFLGGIFGAGGKLPWDEDFTEPTDDSKKLTQISVENQGEEVYIIGGGVIRSTAADNATAVSMGQKIMTYRNMQYYVEVDEAIEHVVNDIISTDSEATPISLSLDKAEDLPDSVKESIMEAHNKITRLLNLKEDAYETIRQFYVDGKQAYQIILDEKESSGIKRLSRLDPAAIRPVKLVETKVEDGIEYVASERRAYLYDSTATRQPGIKNWTMSLNQHKILELPFDSVAYADAGMFTADGTMSVGFLEPAVKPANNLRTCEDATVIYAITRAIDKRAFLIDTGELPTKSAEEYITKLMSKFKTSLNYNPSTGDIDQNKAAISMVEDYWLPRKDGIQATEIQNLEAGKNLGEINHVEYFKDKLYRSLKIPTSRRTGDNLVNIGGSDLAQVTRDEWKFSRYTARIEKRFNNLLSHILMVECVRTGVVTKDEWDEDVRPYLNFIYATDTYIEEQQRSELFQMRLDVMARAETYVGKIFSIETIKKDILRMTDEEIRIELERIRKEKAAGDYENYGDSPLQMKAADEGGNGFGGPEPEPFNIEQPEAPGPEPEQSEETA